MVRIAFSTVRGEGGEEHFEVTGRMPDLNSTMQAALSDSTDTAQLMTTAAANLQILSEFCKELAAAG